MKRILSLALIAALYFIQGTAFADIDCRVNGATCPSNPITGVDFQVAAGSDLLTQTGLRKKIGVVGSTLFATGVAQGNATSIASTTNAVPVGFAYVRMAIPKVADPAFTAKTLTNGVPGQILTISVPQVGDNSSTTGGSATITPTCSTGWSKIKVSAQGDIVVLQYIDSSVCWIINSYDPGAASSITITQSLN